ncbi:hypothetical protein FD725_26335 [Nostoc sp. TCL26-01]|nr:hypothetical protein FD725_26335 [Nostoc sp. TCL26-01]
MQQIEPSYQHHLSLPLVRSHPAATNAIVPLQPQQENFVSSWEHLLTVVQHINHMARELEAKMLELKQVASTINSQINYLSESDGQPDKNICQYASISVPLVKQTPDQSFILTTRKVDLFKAEREATLLAQQLRQRTHGKKLRGSGRKKPDNN